MAENDGWDEWRNHVLAELKKNNGAHNRLFEILDQVRVDIARLQVKSGVWGILGGLIPATITMIYFLTK